MSFPLTKLPDDVIEEVIKQMPSEDLARLLSTSKSFRRDYSTVETTERIKLRKEEVLRERELREIGRRIQRHIVEKVQDRIRLYGVPQQFLNRRGLCAPGFASLTFAGLLGSNYPQYRGEIVVNRNIFMKWFYIYTKINELQTEFDTFRVDENLALLGAPLHWKIGDVKLNPFGALYDANVRKSPEALPYEVLQQLYYVEEYLQEVKELLSRQSLDEKDREGMKYARIQSPIVNG